MYRERRERRFDSPQEGCTRRYMLTAAKKPKCRSSRGAIGLFTAGSAELREGRRDIKKNWYRRMDEKFVYIQVGRNVAEI